MHISHVTIKNYRNLRNVDVDLHRETIVVGENNAGKSNFLRAITLPLISDEIAYTSKNLSWQDINNVSKEAYYDFLCKNKKEIIDQILPLENFEEIIPKIVVELTLTPCEIELYDVKNFICHIDGEKNVYKIRYEFKSKTKELLERVRSIIISCEDISEKTIKQYQMNLLPIDLFSYTIMVPGKNEKIPYDTLRRFEYTALEAERDDFSISTNKLGSKSLIHLLQMKLDTDAKLKVEQEYSHFFETIKSASRMEEIINWQDNSEIKRANDFFNRITALPNMPSMASILNSVQLGYDGQSLSTQGLGYRNLLLMLVLINSLTKVNDLSLDVLTVEEPEAHLCISNIRLMKGFLNAFTERNNFVQLIYSTHSPELIGKVDLSNVVVFHQGNAFSLSKDLTDESIQYLSKNPNVDIYNLLFAKKCILVEGLTEELLIKAYLRSKSELNDIEVISFHKGYINIINIWLRLNKNSNNKLGIIRDYDNQDHAKEVHEKYNEHENIIVTTTTEYTLESEIAKAGDNIEVLKEKYCTKFGWENMSADEIQEDWRNSKSFIMLDICQNLIKGDLPDFTMPSHIQKVLNFMMDGVKS